MEKSRLQEKYDFLLATSLFKIEKCSYEKCLAMACSSDKEYKTKRCQEILTCEKCKKTFCNKHVAKKIEDEWMMGICHACSQ